VSQGTRLATIGWQLSTRLSTTHLSDKTITMKTQFSAISTRNQLSSGGFRTNELRRASYGNEGHSDFISSLRRNTQANQSEVTRWKLVQSTHTRSLSPSTACSGKKAILNRSLCANVFQTFALTASFAIPDTEPSILVDLTQRHTSRFWRTLGHGANASSMIGGSEHHVGLQDGLVGDAHGGVRVFRVRGHGDGYPFETGCILLGGSEYREQLNEKSAEGL